MYDRKAHDLALGLIERGQSLLSISRSTGIARSTLRDWRDHPQCLRQRNVCPRCAEIPSIPQPGDEYAYLLGLYLGDGCISRNGDPAKGVWVLRIACANSWPGLLAECAKAVQAIRPDNKVGIVGHGGCKYVTAYSRHWLCLLPQHGSGKKHDRRIELEAWQRVLTTEHPDRLG
jgi:hypothetical protein